MQFRSKHLLLAAAAGTVTVPAWAQPRSAVSIESVPPGATVRDGAPTAPPLGQTPLRRQQLTRGPHHLLFDLPGYVPGALDVTVGASNPRPFSLALTQGGNVYVAADIDGAPIYLDGAQVGTTPGRINNVPPGAHIVELRLEGREPARETVNVTSGALATVNVTLRPRVAPTGTVRVVVSNPAGPVPTDLQVTLDGVPLAGMPPSSDAVQPGTHIVQVSASGFRSTRREVTVAAGQAQAVAIDLEAAAATTGSLRVIVPVAGAQAFLDGDGLALSGGRVDQPSVTPGQHTVRVTAPGRDAVVRDVVITAGQQRVLELADTDLPPAANRGVLRVTAPQNPEAEIFVDSQSVGHGRFERTNAPESDVVVLVRSPGFDDFTQRCHVAAIPPCEITAALHRTAQVGTLHIQALGLTNAMVYLNDEPQGRPLGDVPNVPAGAVRITVRADNYEPWIREVQVRPGDNAQVIMAAPRRIGPSDLDVARRRAAISTLGAAPLMRGDGALDVFAGFGGMPLELRATMGFVPYGTFRSFGNFAVDGGLAMRTRFDFYEFELRSRAGWRFASDLISAGVELRTYGAVGVRSSSGFGLAMQGNLSFHFNLGGDAQNAAQESSNASVGAFAISLHGGFEYNLDNPGRVNVSLSDSRGNWSLCDNRTADNGGYTGASCSVGGTLRGLAGLSLELGIFRHLTFVASGTLYLPFPDDVQYDSAGRFLGPGSNTTRRPETADFWNLSLPMNVRLGITYKF